MSLPAFDRHKGHLPRTIVQAQQAEVVSEATSLLARVENLMQESEKNRSIPTLFIQPYSSNSTHRTPSAIVWRKWRIAQIARQAH